MLPPDSYVKKLIRTWPTLGSVISKEISFSGSKIMFNHVFGHNIPALINIDLY